MRTKHAWLVAAVLLVGWANLACAEDAPKPAEAGKKAEGKKKGEKKGEAERLYPRGPKIDELKTDLGLTDEQIAKVKEALAPVEKKNEEVEGKADVKAAEEAVQKAKDALKAAQEKSEKARDSFDLLTERKKAVLSAIPEDKKAKAMELLHFPAEKAGAKERKEKKEKKAEAEK